MESDLKKVLLDLPLEHCSVCECQLKVLAGATEPLAEYPEMHTNPVCPDCMRQIKAAGNLPRPDVPYRVWKALNNAGGWHEFDRLHPRRKRKQAKFVIKGERVNRRLKSERNE